MPLTERLVNGETGERRDWARGARIDTRLGRLFTIGLIKLNGDGSYIVDPLSGEPLETYDTSNIKEFAKVWTAFDRRPMRTNIENEGHGRGNRIDPMQLKANGADTKRDLCA